MQTNIGIGGQEVWHERHYMQAGEGARDMQADQSLWPPLHCRGRIPRFLQPPQNAACVLVECGARLGEMGAARGAMKQADTKILFKAGDRARDSRCPGIRGNCSFRKAADLYPSHEHTQRAQVAHFGASVSPCDETSSTR